MNNQKIENLLNLALDASDREREKSPELSAGFSRLDDKWTIIVRYAGNPDVLLTYSPVFLLGNYAILEVTEKEIEIIASLDEVIYIEKPKPLSFTVLEGRSSSCVSEIQTPVISAGASSLNLSGRGCIVGIIDSGIAYDHPVFLNPDGSSRILCIWDQTESGPPPQGYRKGAYYTQTEINEALRSVPTSRQTIVKTQDFSGHGTAVASVAAGNFSENPSVPLGMAVQSELIVVKLGNFSFGSFPRTSELMQAVDFTVKKAIEYGRPLALNLSFGNSYGSHTGTSLLETYLDIAASSGITSIITGTGNEGSAAGHTSGRLSTGETVSVELFISSYEPNINLQIWKAYYDQMTFEIQSPSGEHFQIPGNGPFTYRDTMNQTELLIYYGEPNPYNIYQEIYLDFLPSDTYVGNGLWKILIHGTAIVNGEYHIWLPVQSSLNGSRFTAPAPFTTLTIPSTSSKAVSVGAYNSYNFSYARFSGRGYDISSTNIRNVMKPELVAPGVDIRVAAPDGGFVLNSGTSIAAPFVTGAAAMLMEWGIIDRNDPFLYGEKLKAYLLRGAKPLTGFNEYPNPYIGWGRLCVGESIPK